ncbi:MAG TPA: hypothetical protein VNS63_11370, partial [Blastocatellia bacterium]|nr:hypothetical protein [Blastocatellia bacterium]
DALAGTSGRGGFVTIQPGAPGVGALNGAFGQVILAPGGGNVGIGITNAGSKLTVAGMIETTLGGLKFPDGTLQTTAATSGLASIFHDATLAGNGTSGSPLGVAPSGVGTNQLADNAATAAKIAAGQVVKSLNGLKDDVTLAAGSNITITPSGNTLTIATNTAAGAVTHDATLTGNGTSGSPLGVSVPLSLTVASGGPVIEATASVGSVIRGVSTIGGSIGVYGQVGGGSGALEGSLSGAGVAGNGNSFGVIGSGAIAGVSGSSRTGGTGVEGSGGGGDLFNHAGVGVRGGGGGSSAQSAGGEDTSGGTGVQGNGGQHDTRGGDGVVGIGGDTTFAPGTVGGTGVVGRGGQGAGGIINGLAGFFDGDVVVAGNLLVDGDVTGAIFGQPSAHSGLLAGDFNGNVEIHGNLSASGTKYFKIDHPLDPGNKYLYHAAIESSEVMNLYTGKITLDANGEAVVQMPDWFEALNKDFRYSLTPIGAPGPNLYIAEEVSGNRFKIAGGAAGMKVSWQVTGVRQDAYIRAHPMKVEVEKSEKERGHYLRLELFDQPEETSIQWARNPELMKQMKEQRETGKQKLESKNR